MVTWSSVTDMNTTTTSAAAINNFSWTQMAYGDTGTSGTMTIIFRPTTGAINQHWLGALNSSAVSNAHDADYQFRGSGSAGANKYDVFTPTNNRVLQDQDYTFGDYFKITYDFDSGTVTWYTSPDSDPKVWTTVYTLTGQTKTTISIFAAGYMTDAGIQNVATSDTPSTGGGTLLPPPIATVRL